MDRVLTGDIQGRGMDTPLFGTKEQVDHPGIDKQGSSQISGWFSVAREYGNSYDILFTTLETRRNM